MQKDSVRKYWWNVSDLQSSGFIDALNAATPDARLEFHVGTQLFHIVAADAETNTEAARTGYNYSHPCPPDCR